MPVGFCIIAGDQGHPNGNSFRANQGQEGLQVTEHSGIVLTGVTAVDFRIGVLAVDVEMVDAFGGGCDVFPWDIQGGFGAQMPVLTAAFPKTGKEIRIQQRFSAAEGHTAPGGKEIKLVDFHPVIQHFRGHGGDFGFRVKGKSIEAIPAPQGTAVEADQSGDALPVGLHSQPGTGDDWRLHGIRGNHSPGQANP